MYINDFFLLELTYSSSGWSLRMEISIVALFQSGPSRCGTLSIYRQCHFGGCHFDIDPSQKMSPQSPFEDLHAEELPRQPVLQLGKQEKFARGQVRTVRGGPSSPWSPESFLYFFYI